MFAQLQARQHIHSISELFNHECLIHFLSFINFASCNPFDFLCIYIDKPIQQFFRKLNNFSIFHQPLFWQKILEFPDASYSFHSSLDAGIDWRFILIHFFDQFSSFMINFLNLLLVLCASWSIASAPL